MARKKMLKNKKAGRGGKRTRRTPAQMISDLKAKIEDVKRRAAATELKKSPAIRRTLTIVRVLDKTLDLAADEGQTALRHSLAGARAPLADFLGRQGVKLPKARMPRGRKPAKV